jgi:hypothetical protein
MTHAIYPHGGLTELAPNLWQVEGTLPFPLKRNMTVYRLADGRLLLYSVVAMNDAGMAALEALGRPAVMVVPHPFHVMDAPFYKERYPELTVLAAPDAQAKMGAKVKVDATPEEGLAPLGIRSRTVPGVRYAETVLDLELADGGRAMVVTDIILTTPKGFLMRLLGPPGGAGVARIVKFRQVTDRAKVAGFLRESAGIDALRLVAVAHGAPVVGDCRARLTGFADRC